MRAYLFQENRLISDRHISRLSAVIHYYLIPTPLIAIAVTIFYSPGQILATEILIYLFYMVFINLASFMHSGWYTQQKVMF